MWITVPAIVQLVTYASHSGTVLTTAPLEKVPFQRRRRKRKKARRSSPIVDVSLSSAAVATSICFDRVQISIRQCPPSLQRELRLAKTLKKNPRSRFRGYKALLFVIPMVLFGFASPTIATTANVTLGGAYAASRCFAQTAIATTLFRGLTLPSTLAQRPTSWRLAPPKASTPLL